jgi:hypothetical protein
MPRRIAGLVLNALTPMKKFLLFAMAFLGTFLSAQAERDTLRVYFDEGVEAVSAFQQSLIDIFVQTHYATGEVIVAGHTDDLGNPLSNLQHSRTRAQVVAEYLLNKGMQANQLVMEAWGETKPLYPNNNPINRARNRRVELIGIPNPTQAEDVRQLATQQLTLSNGIPLPYREMTTADGRPKQIWVITLDKEVAGVDLLGASTLLSNLGGQSPAFLNDPCRDPKTFRFLIPTSAEMRCPLSEIEFKDAHYTTSKINHANGLRMLKPVKTDSGYFFMVELDDMRACLPTDYTIGNECHTEQPVHIKLEGVRASKLMGTIKTTGERITPAPSGDGRYYILHYINDDPSTLVLNAVVYKNKHRKARLNALPLSRLKYDVVADQYIIRAKDLRGLRKQQ